MHLWPGVTELVRAEILSEVLLDLVVAEGLHGIPGTRAISAWKICIYLRSIWGLSASICIYFLLSVCLSRKLERSWTARVLCELRMAFSCIFYHFLLQVQLTCSQNMIVLIVPVLFELLNCRTQWSDRVTEAMSSPLSSGKQHIPQNNSLSAWKQVISMWTTRSFLNLDEFGGNFQPPVICVVSGMGIHLHEDCAGKVPSLRLLGFMVTWGDMGWPWGDHGYIFLNIERYMKLSTNLPLELL